MPTATRTSSLGSSLAKSARTPTPTPVSHSQGPSADAASEKAPSIAESVKVTKVKKKGTKKKRTLQPDEKSDIG